MHLLETTGLVKEYGGRRVVNSVAINVKRGEVVGLLGKLIYKMVLLHLKPKWALASFLCMGLKLLSAVKHMELIKCYSINCINK